MLNKKDNGDIGIELEVTVGQETLNLKRWTDRVQMFQREDGLVYFDSLPNQLFRLKDYRWDGPKYKTVTETTEKGKAKDRGKEKRKGGLGGAVVGTVLMPGVGTAIGYAMTSKKVTKNKGRSNVQCK